MVSVQINNQWHLRQNEYELLMANNMGTKCTWWAKNLGTKEFVDYAKQTGTRIRGDQPFMATLDLEPGEYMFATGDYSTVSDEGRHCSQVFYVYVTEEGGAVCRKTDLPSNGGAGVAVSASTGGQVTLDGAGATAQSSWSSVPAQPTVPKEEFYIIPNYSLCMQDMAIRASFEGCDDCGLIKADGPLDCTNCLHALNVYAKKE